MIPDCLSDSNELRYLDLYQLERNSGRPIDADFSQKIDSNFNRKVIPLRTRFVPSVDEDLMQILLGIEEEEIKIMSLQELLTSESLRQKGMNLFSVLHTGAYVGEPNDLRNFRINPISEITYPVRGFSLKVLDFVY